MAPSQHLMPDDRVARLAIAHGKLECVVGNHAYSSTEPTAMLTPPVENFGMSATAARLSGDGHLVSEALAPADSSSFIRSHSVHYVPRV